MTNINKINNYIVNTLWMSIRFLWVNKFNKLVVNQLRFPDTIPIVIINYNQLYYLEKLVNFLLNRGFKNIVVVDNKSTYPPLLKYYEEIKDKVSLELLEENYGHMVFFRNEKLQNKYGRGYFVVTDADIVPNENLPNNFMNIMLDVLRKQHLNVTKVGFALDIKNIKESYLLKEKVINWESQFWEKEIDNQMYLANIDTTFALYKPGYPKCFANQFYISGIRLAADFTALHGGWEIDSKNLTEEQKYYYNTSNNSASWKSDQTGALIVSDEFNY